ncbi:MAG: glycosyltransferase family 4 protein [Clostridia bacterium]|nr:glycosyltransferase family 4 protein [Clostridia bacterium]
MKKVLLVATVQSHICQFHKPLVEILHEKGVEVHVAARDNLAEKNGLKLDFVDKVFDVPFHRSPFSSKNLKAYKILKKIIDDGDYDVIHCNTPVAGILTRMAAKKARKHGTKVFYTAHGFHFYKGAPKKNWLIWYPIEKFFAKKCDKLITITTEDFDLAKNKFKTEVVRIHGVGVDENRFFTVPPEEKIRLKREMGFGDDQPIILNVGELLPNKNQKMAVRAMKRIVEKYPSAKLFIAGNGSERENLENEISTLGLNDNVTMLGYCTHLQDYQHIADVLLACSYREGLPLNVVEAMLSGTAVVASNNRGHRELIKDGETGFIVNCDDDVAMADRVNQLISDSDKRDSMAKAAEQYALQFDYSNVKKELRFIYFNE